MKTKLASFIVIVASAFAAQATSLKGCDFNSLKMVRRQSECYYPRGGVSHSLCLLTHYQKNRNPY